MKTWKVIKTMLFAWIFIYTLRSATCEWNDNSPSNLEKLSGCNVSLDQQKYLYAICEMYCTPVINTAFLGEKMDAILVSLALRSKYPVELPSSAIYLWMVNVTIEKFNIPNRIQTKGTPFSISSEMESYLSNIEKGILEIVFETLGRMVAVANPQELCNEEKGYGGNATCKMIISAVPSMSFAANWKKDSFSDFSKLRQSIDQIANTYLLYNSKISLFSARVNPNVNKAKMFLRTLQLLKPVRIEFVETNFGNITNVDFRGFSNLKVLNLTKGGIRTIESNAFDDLGNLTVLDLSYNKLEVIPSALYRGSLPSIAYLSMEENMPGTNIFALKTNISAKCPVFVLKLSRTPVTRINTTLSRSFPLLKELHLDRCNISFLSSSAFANLSFLLTLNLARNSIKYLPDDIFSSLSSLRALDLAENRLTEFESSYSNRLFNLTNLNLRSNLIRNWNFMNPSQLRTLDLSSNRIRVLTEKTLFALRNVEEVNLSMNPYDCSPCPLYHHSWLRMPNASNPNLHFCSSPPNLLDEVALNLSSTFDSCLEMDLNVALICSLSIIFFLVFAAIACSAGYHFRWYLRYFAFRFTALVWHRRNPKTCVNPYKYDAFVSYAFSERSWITNELIPNLETSVNGLRFCIHDRDFMPGDYIIKNIIENIEKSRKVLVLLSKTYVESRWCMLEAHIAQHMLGIFEKNRETIVLVKVEDISSKCATKWLSYLIKTRTFLEWPSNDEEKPQFWERLESCLGKENDQQSILPFCGNGLRHNRYDI